MQAIALLPRSAATPVQVHMSIVLGISPMPWLLVSDMHLPDPLSLHVLSHDMTATLTSSLSPGSIATLPSTHLTTLTESHGCFGSEGLHLVHKRRTASSSDG